MVLIVIHASTVTSGAAPGRNRKRGDSTTPPASGASGKHEQPGIPPADEKPPEDAGLPALPSVCVHDINPTGRYELKVVSVPSLEMAVKQCSGARTGTALQFSYDVEADPESNFVRVHQRLSAEAIIRDSRLERSVTDVCRAKGATIPVVTYFSWHEYISLKEGWSISYTGFGSGDDGNASIARKITLVGIMLDAKNMPVCYLDWTSE